MNNLSCAVACISTSVMDMFIVANIDWFCSTEKLIIYRSFLLDFFSAILRPCQYFSMFSIRLSVRLYLPSILGQFYTHY